MYKKKILFICTEGFDTPNPSNHLINSLIEDLIENGFNIHLIQSRRTRINEDIPKNLRKYNNLVVDIIDRKIILKNSFIKRYLEEALYSFKCYFKWRKVKEVDAVFVQSCPTVVFSIILLKLFNKSPILYSIQDMWPGSAVESGVLNRKIITIFFYNLQKIAYKYSDILTVISEDMKNKVIEQGVSESKIIPVVNWYDDKTVSEVNWQDNKFVEKYNLSKNMFYVQYAGTMGYVFNYKLILDIAERLILYNDIEFHMIGQGSQREEFVKEVETRQLKNIKFFPLEPQNMVSDVYSACSVCLIPLKRGVIGNSVPSKAGLVMACNRTILNSVDEDSIYFKLFNENKIGISVSNNNSIDASEAILRLYKDQTLCAEYAKKGKIFGEQYYSRKANTIKFIKLFKHLTTNHTNFPIHE